MTELADDTDDLLDDPFFKNVGPKKLVRTKKQEAAQAAAAEKAALAAKAQQLAQMANLIIAGYSLTDIGAAIGASADEVDRMLTEDSARFVRNQPSLRIWVRNYVSGKYADLLEAVWDEATDKAHPEKLENQDRALRILDKMAKLHGAEAPTQAEVKVDAAPEAVEKMVAALAAGRGQGYDASIFDTIPGEVVHEAADAARAELDRAAEGVGEPEADDAEF